MIGMEVGVVCLEDEADSFKNHFRRTFCALYKIIQKNAIQC